MNKYIVLHFLTVNSYPKSSLKREYGQRDELPPRSRAAAIYGPRAIPERRQSYRDDYSSRGPGYSDIPRSTARPAPRRAYVDGGYGHRFERPPPPPPSYREARARDYDSMSGSKRPYAALVSIDCIYSFAIMLILHHIMFSNFSYLSNFLSAFDLRPYVSRTTYPHVMLIQVSANLGLD